MRQKRKTLEIEPLSLEEVMPVSVAMHNYNYQQHYDGLYTYPQYACSSFQSILTRSIMDDRWPTPATFPARKRSQMELSVSFMPLFGSGSLTPADDRNITFIDGAEDFQPGVDNTGSFTTK